MKVLGVLKFMGEFAILAAFIFGMLALCIRFYPY